MDGQLAVVAVVVAGAVLYLGWSTLREWRGSRSGCGGGCGKSASCSSTTERQVNFLPAEQLTLRRRSGEPEG